MTDGYLPRIVDGQLAALLADFPAVLLVGPRATGKTTTGTRHATTILRLDDPNEAVVANSVPDAILRGLREPVLIDEWHLAPAILGAVKRAVDTERGTGRFIVTGSVHARLDEQTWPGTGRLIEVEMHGLTARELLGADLTRPPFIDRVAVDGVDAIATPSDPPDLRGYLELALRGGFPEAVRAPDHHRLDWATSYLSQLFTRDVEGARDPEKLRRYFEVLALNTAGAVTDKTVFDAAGINKKTADAYDTLLRNLYITSMTPAWYSNRLKRLAQLPKRYVLDPLLVAGALRLTVDGLMRDGNMLGRVLDTFVAAQLRAELAAGTERPRLFHLRDQNGRREVDILVELDVNRVIGIEIKAAGAPRREAAQHLMWLRDELGDRFVGGVVLHTGPRTYPLDDRIVAAPISALWS